MLNPYTPPTGSVVHELKIPVDKLGAPVYVHLMQYDQTIPIIAVHPEGNNGMWTVPANADAHIRMEKPDGKHIYDPCLGVSQDRSIIYVAVSPQMTAAYGKGVGTVEIVSGTGIVHTGLIIFDIDRNPVPSDAYESTDEYKSLEQLVSDAQKAATAAANSQKAAATNEANSKANADAAKTASEEAKKAAKEAGDAATQVIEEGIADKLAEMQEIEESVNGDAEQASKAAGTAVAARDTALDAAKNSTDSLTQANDAASKAEQYRDAAKEYADQAAAGAGAATITWGYDSEGYWSVFETTE